jgi:hypothetical protein
MNRLPDLNFLASRLPHKLPSPRLRVSAVLFRHGAVIAPYVSGRRSR